MKKLKSTYLFSGNFFLFFFFIGFANEPVMAQNEKQEEVS
jgi:hypothetical protein